MILKISVWAHSCERLGLSDASSVHNMSCLSTVDAHA